MSRTQDETSVSTGGGWEEPAVPADGVRTYVITSCAQFIAICAVTILNFAAAYYVYKTYSLVVLGFIYAFPFVVLLAFSPIAGSLIDRWGVRRALLVSNVGGVVLTVATLAVLPFVHGFALWNGGIVVSTVPLIKALLLPAFEASVPFLVPKRHFGRANGMRLFVNGFGAVVLAYVAIFLAHTIGLKAICLLVLVLLSLSILAMLRVRIPVPRRELKARPGLRVLLAEFRDAWHYVRARPGLPALLLFFGLVSFSFGMSEVLLPLIVIGFASEHALIGILAVGSVGMAVGGVAMTIWGGPRRRVRGALGYTLVLAAAMVLGSLRQNVILLAAGAFIFLGSGSIIVGNVQCVFHAKVEPEMQGRVMALKNVVYAVTLMAGDILAGVSGSIVMPLVGEYHVRSHALATVIGGGAGRTFALLAMVTGGLIALCVWFAHRSASMRHVEDALPDVTPEDLAGPPVARLAADA
jgi:MFS transporter, DHA3 family, macrolide efflux protein